LLDWELMRSCGRKILGVVEFARIANFLAGGGVRSG
jgi:hypothetical protein